MKTDQLPRIEDFRHHCPVQVRFNDIDILGHLNNTVYFSFYDTGKAYYFNAVRGPKMNWQRVETVIANINCAYIDSILFGQEIDCYTRCLSMSEKSFRLQQMLVRRADRKIMSVCETVMVSISPDDHRAVEIPESWRDDINSFEGKDLSTKKKYVSE